MQKLSKRAVQCRTAENDRHRAYIRALYAHAEVIEVAERIAEQWSREDREDNPNGRRSNVTAAFDLSSIECVAIDLYLGEDDSLKRDSIELLEKFLDDDRYSFSGQSEYTEFEWIGWRFKLKNEPYSGRFGRRFPTIMLRFWYGKSKLCRRVGTGEFTNVEETKLVCD